MSARLKEFVTLTKFVLMSSPPSMKKPRPKRKYCLNKTAAMKSSGQMTGPELKTMSVVLKVVMRRPPLTKRSLKTIGPGRVRKPV